MKLSDFLAYCCIYGFVAAFFLDMSFVSILLVIDGCNLHVQSECLYYTPKSMKIVSSTVNQHVCSCGRECAGVCYFAELTLQEGNTTCKVELEDETFKSYANKDKDAHPPNSYISVYVSKNNPEICETGEDLETSFNFGIWMGIIFLLPTALFILFSFVVCTVSIIDVIISKETYSYLYMKAVGLFQTRYFYNSLRHRNDVIHKYDIILLANLDLINRIVGCNLVALTCIIGSLIINIADLAHNQHSTTSKTLMIATILSQGAAFCFIFYIILQHRLRLEPYNFVSLLTMLCRRAVLCWLKVITCALSLTFAIHEHSKVGITWNILCITFATISQPKFMIRIFITCWLWLYNVIMWMFFGSPYEYDFYEVYRQCWLPETEANIPLLRHNLGNELPMLQAIMKTHIINTRMEGAGAKISRDDDRLLSLFRILREENKTYYGI